MDLLQCVETFAHRRLRDRSLSKNLNGTRLANKPKTLERVTLTFNVTFCGAEC